jgi:hypothetical protein
MPRKMRALGGRVCLGAGVLAVTYVVGLKPLGASTPVAGSAKRTATSARANLSRHGWNQFSDRTVDLKVLDLALRAATCATRARLVDDPSTLTLIDYSRRSIDRRLWVFDLESGRVLHHELVAHGQGTGGDLATQFSNAPDSHQSSLGLFVTADTYVGRNGYSLRLDGLDPGFNDRARERAIVVHGAPYVSDDFARAQGRLGRSWGCPALGDQVARTVIDRIKGGNLVFAYYPNEAWLNGSRLLGECQA